MFRIRYDYYKYQILFFDLTNASTFFQIYINKALTKKLNVYVIVYLNNIIVYFFNLKQYNKNVCWMLEQLVLHKFYIAKNKCQFCTISIDFLKYCILFADVEMQKNKIKSIWT